MRLQKHVDTELPVCFFTAKHRNKTMARQLNTRSIINNTSSSMSAGHVTQKGTPETWDEPPISLWPVETFEVKGLQCN